MRRLPLRVRLVAGFLAAMAVLLTAAGAFVYWRVQYALDRGLDAELSRATATIAPLIDASGRVTSSEAADATGAGWQVLDETGQVFDSGRPALVDPLVTPADLGSVGNGTLTKDIGDLLPVSADPYRVHVTAVDGGRLRLLVAVRRDHRDEALRELLLQLTLAGLGALVGAALVGNVLARKALGPVERYRQRAEEIAGGADGLRLDVPTERDDEVTRLGHTLNEMLATLERSLDRERRFVNDASHELRTPLTLLTSRIQLARRRARTAQEHEVVLDELSVDVARLAQLTEHLLELGTTNASAGRTEIGKVASGVVERRLLARHNEAQEIVLELPATDAVAEIDPLALERVVTNLIENAFMHGGSPVRVAVAPLGDRWARLLVDDAGPGMPPELLVEATSRFSRSVDARSRPGAGLGLALVEQIVRTAGGELRLCYAGTHTTHGGAAPFPCTHGVRMTVCVFLPLVQ